MPTAEQDGLEWAVAAFGLQPRWKYEPNIEIIERLARQHLAIDTDDKCHVSFHAQGAFNKLYLVLSTRGKYLMRVSLPAHPHQKTESEVATLDFVRKYTEIPVPRVFAFDSSNNNDLGFEWILMELMPGVSLLQRWRKLGMGVKEKVVKRVALYQSQLLQATSNFRSIGNIFPGSDGRGKLAGSEFEIGQTVSQIFFWGENINQKVPRPNYQEFNNKYGNKNDDKGPGESDGENDEDDIEDAKSTKRLAQTLLDALPKRFPAEEQAIEQTALWHSDLSLQKILVDEDGEITAIIDWECVSVVPTWAAAQVPQFLIGTKRDTQPLRDGYQDGDEEDEEEAREEGLDNEGKNGLFWIHLLEWEQTQLRKIYDAEMEKLWPKWKQLKEAPQKADFENAVARCPTGFGSGLIGEWLEDLQEGKPWCLRDQFMEPF
ncbi:hypothetical protein MW887_008128 [Aspergillus wentii]|nr:hypothetical protein MW887_008128 [Aspergillus wentii]